MVPSGHAPYAECCRTCTNSPGSWLLVLSATVGTGGTSSASSSILPESPPRSAAHTPPSEHVTPSAHSASPPAHSARTDTVRFTNAPAPSESKTEYCTRYLPATVVLMPQPATPFTCALPSTRRRLRGVARITQLARVCLSTAHVSGLRVAPHDSLYVSRLSPCLSLPLPHSAPCTSKLQNSSTN
jgi:hypothetical protein